METHLNATTNDSATVRQSQLASDAQLGVTRLAVRDLSRSLPFYEQGLGLEHLGTDRGLARLGVDGVAVLELAQEPDARRPGRHGGLFHVALLYPGRLELARVGKRLHAHGVQIEGASDHGSHEAFYLADLDGNGLELSADRPRDQWPDPQVEYSSGPQPLDLRGLMSLVDGEALVPRAGAGLKVGHVHLHVGDIDAALAFYRDLVGFELRARLPTAAFVSLGGYHHHLGLNVWKGQGVAPAPDNALGLRFWTVIVPGPQHVEALSERLGAAGVQHRFDGRQVVVRDPWNSELRVGAQR